jgi:hypothetical protein
MVETLPPRWSGSPNDPQRRRAYLHPADNPATYGLLWVAAAAAMTFVFVTIYRMG